MNNIDTISFMLQLYSVILLLKDFNNADLMQELCNQDEIYLKKIIQQNEEIINLLKEGGNYGRKTNWKN